jgi:hypothetical protein
MKRIWACYLAGVAAAATAGFCSPWWWTGFLPVAAGCMWAAFDLIEIEDADGDIANATPLRSGRSN